MAALGIDSSTMIIFYKSEVRVHLEFFVPVWAGAIMVKQARALSKVQRLAMTIMDPSTRFMNHEMACDILGLTPLSVCRKELCLRWARKTASNSRHQDIFNRNKTITRHAPEFVVPHARHTRMAKSPVCYLSQLMNDNPFPINNDRTCK